MKLYEIYQDEELPNDERPDHEKERLTALRKDKSQLYDKIRDARNEYYIKGILIPRDGPEREKGGSFRIVPFSDINLAGGDLLVRSPEHDNIADWFQKQISRCQRMSILIMGQQHRANGWNFSIQQ